MVLREMGIDISPLPMAAAAKHVAEADALREMRVDEIAAGVARGIGKALGKG